jgi:glycosyltransferase involved in cell wall biosynthesis
VYLADIRFPMERANGIQTAETVHALARRGLDIDLVVRRTDSRSDADCLAFFGLAEHPGLQLRRLAVPRKAPRLGFMARALLQIIRGGYDLVYTRDLGLAYAALATRFLHRRPVVYEAIAMATAFRREAASLYEGRKSPSPLRRTWQNHVEGSVVRRADGLIATTSHLLAALEADFGKPRRSAVIPNGTRVPAERPPRRPPGARPQVYYVGQLYPWKGVDGLVEAMRGVPEGDLVIVGGLTGEPDLGRLQKLAADLGLSERVRFRGYVPPSEVESERAHADLVVIPHAESRTAREFTSPLKLFEAMASGRPIVATDLPSVREILVHEENALLVPPGDPLELASAIRRLLNDDALAERIASRAFEQAKEFSWDARARRIAELLGSLRPAS